MLKFTTWFIRILLIMGLLELACAAAAEFYFHQWSLAIVMSGLFVSTILAVRVYRRRQMQPSTGAPNSGISMCARLRIFWTGMALALLLVLVFFSAHK
jgi:heme/copper-type cytochrome/quinol oxidase subunit 2